MPNPLTSVYGGYTFAELQGIDSLPVADDPIAIGRRRVGDPIEYRTSDRIGVLAHISDVSISTLRITITFDK